MLSSESGLPLGFFSSSLPLSSLDIALTDGTVFLSHMPSLMSRSRTYRVEGSSKRSIWDNLIWYSDSIPYSNWWLTCTHLPREDSRVLWLVALHPLLDLRRRQLRLRPADHTWGDTNAWRLFIIEIDVRIMSWLQSFQLETLLSSLFRIIPLLWFEKNFKFFPQVINKPWYLKQSVSQKQSNVSTNIAN